MENWAEGRILYQAANCHCSGPGSAGRGTHARPRNRLVLAHHETLLKGQMEVCDSARPQANAGAIDPLPTRKISQCVLIGFRKASQRGKYESQHRYKKNAKPTYGSQRYSVELWAKHQSRGSVHTLALPHLRQ